MYSSENISTSDSCTSEDDLLKEEQIPVFVIYEEEQKQTDGLGFISSIDDETNGSTEIMSSAVQEWALISRGILRSNSIAKQNTIYSLKHQPSNDRRSNAYLMGINLQSMILGTSVLGLPFCVKIAGIWSIVMIMLVGLFANFSAIVLADCQYQESYSNPHILKRVHVSFVEMADICMNSVGACIMKVLVYLSLLRNVVVVILLTDLSQEILLGFGVVNYDKNLLAVFWTIASIPLLFVTKVSYLAWVSFIGLNLYLAALAAILVITFTELKTWNFGNISWDFNIEGVGIATGIIMNSYSVHINMPALEASLKKPKKYKCATNTTFLMNNISKIAFAICGYLTYLGDTKEEIVINVSTYKPLPQILKAAIILFTFSTVPLQSFVAFELIDDTFKRYFPIFNKITWLLITRLFFMTIALFISVLLPHFGLVVSLIGSIRGSMITLILPCAFYIMLKNHDIRFYKLVVSYIIVAFGILAGLLGLYSSVRALIRGST